MFNVLVGRLNINTKPEAIDKVKRTYSRNLLS